MYVIIKYVLLSCLGSNLQFILNLVGQVPGNSCESDTGLSGVASISGVCQSQKGPRAHGS